MKYKNTVEAVFIDRPNRFVANVLLDGRTETVHVKNTGRCRELLLQGCRVILDKSDNPERKTAYDLVAVYKDNLGWVNIDSQAPNRVVLEWLKSKDSIFGEQACVKPEYSYGKSRIDFYIEQGERKILLEVKGCTLELGGTGYFPDAPTERGVKHLRELEAAVKKGYECYVAFVIAMPGVKMVFPNIDTHPEFGTALEDALKSGVKQLNLMCAVSPEELNISGCWIISDPEILKTNPLLEIKKT